MPSASVSGERNPISTVPGAIAETSSGVGRATLTIVSTPSSRPPASRSVAPASA